MKSVLISIQPYWVFLIIAKAMGWKIDKEKTIEVRKNLPKAENWDKVVKIYCSKDKESFSKIPREYQPIMERLLGNVIGEFVCDEIIVATYGQYCKIPLAEVHLDSLDLMDYADGKTVYGWHISQLKLYDRPRYLGRFVVPSRVGCCNEGKCRGCQFFIRGNAMAGIEADCTATFNTDEYKPLRRPPQSWCYVEESGL